MNFHTDDSEAYWPCPYDVILEDPSQHNDPAMDLSSNSAMILDTSGGFILAPDVPVVDIARGDLATRKDWANQHSIDSS